MILAWHFVNGTLRDGSPIPPDGEWLHHKGECVMCTRGLHASKRLIDALQYAQGSTICRVACDDIVAEQADKLVCRSRFIMWRLESSDELLREFARKAALSVIHLWNAPPIVKQYLETGDESIRAAAWDAVRDAARDAVRDAVRDSAWDAAWVAARDAARAAAWDAARDAVRDAVRDSAWDAAWVAARDAARAAAWDAARAAAWAAAWAAVRAAVRAAAWDAVRDAARDAAWDAAFEQFNTDLEAMVLAARGNPDDARLLTLVPMTPTRRLS